MSKLLLFLALVGVVMGLTATMNNALRNQVVIDFKNAIVPILSKQVEYMKLPDVHGGHGLTKYSVENIEIRVHPITPGQINIQFIQGSSIRVTGTSFGMRGTAKAKGKVGPVHKTVGVEINVDHVSFGITIVLQSVNAKPNIGISAFDFGLSSGHVHIKISGGFIGKLIQVVVNLLKGHLVKHLVSTIKSKVPQVATAKINSLLNGLPTDIRVTDKIFMKYEFSIPPAVKADYLLTGIVAYLHPVGDPTPPSFNPKPIPEIDGASQKGVQFFVSEFIVKTALDTAQRLNLMNLRVSKKIDIHQVDMTCATTSAPNFNFNKAVSATGAGSCEVILDGNPATKFKALAGINFSLSEHVKNAIIFFAATKLEFSSLSFEPVNADTEWFKKVLNEIIAAILEVVNSELGQKGIPLPTMKEVDYSDIIQYVGDGYMMVGTTPVFHFTMGEQENVDMSYDV